MERTGAYPERGRKMGATTQSVVYACPICDERFVDERRCPDCNVFCRKVGIGGCCPSCGEIVSADELES
jgi:hypothetical protein